jgi:hypothetical protein
MKASYLKAMDIVHWRLRPSATASSAQERELLAAMTQALGVQAITDIPYSLAEILKNPSLKADIWPF